MRWLRLIPLLLFALPAFAAGGTCPTGTYSIQGSTGTLTALGLNNGCYFVDSASGSDSNDGLSEASGHPWAHAPGMQGCTSNCSSAFGSPFSTKSGYGIILKGGDTWGASSLGWQWAWSGTSSHPNYLGVDPAWYNSGVCGASWCRPILNPAGSAMTSSYYIFLNNGSTGIYTTVDNLEETNWSCAAMESGTMNGMISPNAEFENMYVHGWSYTFPDTTCQVYAFGANISDGASQVANSSAHNNVVDGSDQSPSPASHSLIPVGCVLHMHDFHNNICSNVYNVNGDFDLIYGNLFTTYYAGNSGDHCNMTNIQGALNGPQVLVLNNIYTNMQCSGGLILWIQGNSCSASFVGLAANNIFYAVESGSVQEITTTTHPSSGTNCGQIYITNNTCVSTASQQCAGNGEASPRVMVYLANNHLIGTTLCLNTGAYCFDEGNELSQTTSAATAQGYTSTETYAYSPVSTCTPSTCSTVQAGQNVSSNIASWCPANNPLSDTCATFSFTGVLAAALSDTTYASENTSNHTVTLRSTNVRGSTWDIGAYQFLGTTQSNSPCPACFAGIVQFYGKAAIQ